MADNVQLPITGTGTADVVVASDDVASVQFPFVKIVDGTLGSTEKIGGDAANGLDVDVTRLPALVAGSANIGDVDVASIAAGDNNIGNVDIVSGTITTVSTVTAVTSITNAVTVAQATAANLNVTEASAVAIKTAVETIDNAIAGTEMQVDVVTMPAITGAVTANAGTDLNTSLLALEAGGNLASIDGSIATVRMALGDDSYTEGSSHAFVVAAVRRDADTTLVDTTNEFAPLQVDARGLLKVEAFSGEALPVTLTSTTVTGTVTVADSSTGASVANATSSDGGTALTATDATIKSSAGTLMGWYIYNPNPTAQFVQFWNALIADITVGTTAPLFMLTIPAGSASNLWLQPGGIAFSTGIAWAATSTAGGNGAPTTALDAVAFYK